MMFARMFLPAAFILAAAVACAEDSRGLKLLDLKAAQLELQRRKGDLDRALQLKERGLISEQDFAGIRTQYLQAQVEFEKSLIKQVGTETRVVLESAVKIQGADGRKLVRVTVRNESRDLTELQGLAVPEESLFPLGLLKEVTNVYVSLKSDGKIVSDPFERRIDSLPINQSAVLTFQLLKDVENLDVCVTTGTDQIVTSVYLQKDVSANVVTINSARFSQEADLERDIDYDLSLEKFSGEENVFTLAAVNLPSSVAFEFIDPQTQTRLSQIKFTAGVTNMNLVLKLHLPRDPDDAVVLDRPLEFHVLVLNDDQARTLRGMQARPGGRLAAEEIARLKAGAVQLELIPRGVGRIDVQAPNLYHETKTGQRVEMEISLRNAGTRTVQQLRVRTELPMSWHATVAPELIPVLDPSKETTVRIVFEPPADAPVGDYEPRITTEGTSGSSRVTSPDKTVRIHIEDTTNVLAIGALVLLLVAVLVGVVVVGIRMTRK